MEATDNGRQLSPGRDNGDAAVGRLLILTGSLPFAVGGILAVLGGGDQLPDVCVFRSLTGLPCPLCGGTRAFIHAMSGDGSFLSYNAFWVFVALALILTGAITLLTRAPVEKAWRQSGRLALYLIATLVAGGWIWALLNQSTIAS